MVCAPPALAARATAPMQDTEPPPETSVCPRRAISAPVSAASRKNAGSISSEEEQ